MLLNNSVILSSLLSIVLALPAAVEPQLKQVALEQGHGRHRHHEHECRFGKKNGFDKKEAHEADREEHLEVNSGWNKFFFKGCESEVETNYVFKTHGASTLKVTDAYCSGDSFRIYDHGRLILETSFAEADDCETYESKPRKAAKDWKFSSGSVALEHGHHNLTIKVVRSPFGEGAAFLRVDSIISKCPCSHNGLTVVDTPVPHHKAAQVCKSLGLRLADVTTLNFVDATNLAFQCSGAFSKTWIGSYWDEKYCGACLALYTGASAPGGSVNVPDSCKEALPVLCQQPLLEEGEVLPERGGSSDSTNPWFRQPCSSSSSSSECKESNGHHCRECSNSPLSSFNRLPEECVNALPGNGRRPADWHTLNSTVEWHGPYKPHCHRRRCHKPRCCKPRCHRPKTSCSSSSSSSSESCRPKPTCSSSSSSSESCKPEPTCSSSSSSSSSESCKPEPTCSSSSSSSSSESCKPKPKPCRRPKPCCKPKPCHKPKPCCKPKPCHKPKSSSSCSKPCDRRSFDSSHLPELLSSSSWIWKKNAIKAAAPSNSAIKKPSAFKKPGNISGNRPNPFQAIQQAANNNNSNNNNNNENNNNGNNNNNNVKANPQQPLVKNPFTQRPKQGNNAFKVSPNNKN